MRVQTITLEITYDESKHDPPVMWPWHTLTGCRPQDCRQIDASPIHTPVEVGDL